MPSFFHRPCDSPRSPYERQSTRTRAPREEYNAMAPPARQTKSAACALTTSNLSFDKSMLSPECASPNSPRRVAAEKFFLLLNQTARYGRSHSVDFRRRESGVQQLLREHREAFGDRRIGLLSEVGRKHRAFDACGADVGEDRFPGRLVGVIGGEAVLDDRPQVGEFGLFGA